MPEQQPQNPAQTQFQQVAQPVAAPQVQVQGVPQPQVPGGAGIGGAAPHAHVMPAVPVPAGAPHRGYVPVAPPTVPTLPMQNVADPNVAMTAPDPQTAPDPGTFYPTPAQVAPPGHAFPTPGAQQVQQGSGVPAGWTPGQPQPQQQGQEATPYQVKGEDFPEASQEQLQFAVNKAQEAGVAPEQVNDFVESQLYYLNAHSDPDVYNEHQARITELEQALVERYGQQGAVDAFTRIGQAAVDRGGQALLHKLITDPDMLHGEIISSFLEGGGEGGQGRNYYDQWLDRGGQGAAPAAAPVAAGAPGAAAANPGTALDPAAVAQAFQQHQTLAVKNSMDQESWNKRNITLHQQMRAANMAAVGAGGAF